MFRAAFGPSPAISRSAPSSSRESSRACGSVRSVENASWTASIASTRVSPSRTAPPASDPACVRARVEIQPTKLVGMPESSSPPGARPAVPDVTKDVLQGEPPARPRAVTGAQPRALRPQHEACSVKIGGAITGTGLVVDAQRLGDGVDGHAVGQRKLDPLFRHEGQGCVTGGGREADHADVLV